MPPTLNTISLKNADKRYKKEPGIIIDRSFCTDNWIKVYNRSKYRIEFDIEHVPSSSFMDMFACGVKGLNLQIHREQNKGPLVQKFFLPPVKNPMDAIMKPIQIMGGKYRITSWMDGILRDEGRLLKLHEYPVFQNRHYEEIKGRNVDSGHEWKQPVIWNPYSWF